MNRMVKNKIYLRIIATLTAIIAIGLGFSMAVKAATLTLSPYDTSKNTNFVYDPQNESLDISSNLVLSDASFFNGTSINADYSYLGIELGQYGDYWDIGGDTWNKKGSIQGAFNFGSITSNKITNMSFPETQQEVLSLVISTEYMKNIDFKNPVQFRYYLAPSQSANESQKLYSNDVNLAINPPTPEVTKVGNESIILSLPSISGGIDCGKDAILHIKDETTGKEMVINNPTNTTAPELYTIDFSSLADIDFSRGHTLDFWATNGTGGISGVTKQLISGTSTIASPTIMYYSPMTRGGNSNPAFSINGKDPFAENKLDNGDLNGQFTVNFQDNNYGKNTSTQYYVDMYINDSVSNPLAFAYAPDPGATSVSSISSNSRLFGYFNPTDSPELTDTYQKKNTFRLGQNLYNTGGASAGLAGNNSWGWLTDNTAPFIIIPPKPTINASDTHLIANDSGTTNVFGSEEIVGSNDVKDPSGTVVKQTGNSVYAFKDQGGDGIYTQEDQDYDKNTSNAIKTVTNNSDNIDSNGNFDLKFDSSEEFKAGDKIWIIETNKSGGTSGIARTDSVGTTDNPDGTMLASKSGAAGVSVIAPYGFSSYPNWDFGSDQRYDISKNNSYNLKRATDSSGNSSESSISFNDYLSNVAMTATMSNLTNEKGESVNNASINLGNIVLNGTGGNSNSTSLDEKTLTPGSQTTIVNNLANSDKNTNWKLNFGSEGADGENDNIMLNIPGGQNVQVGEKYSTTISWQLTNSIS